MPVASRAAAFAAAKAKMAKRLMDELTRAQDPRVVENPPRFEQPPFADGSEGGGKKNRKAPAK